MGRRIAKKKVRGRGLARIPHMHGVTTKIMSGTGKGCLLFFLFFLLGLARAKYFSCDEFTGGARSDSRTFFLSCFFFGVLG